MIPVSYIKFSSTSVMEYTSNSKQKYDYNKIDITRFKQFNKESVYDKIQWIQLSFRHRASFETVQQNK